MKRYCITYHMEKTVDGRKELAETCITVPIAVENPNEINALLKGACAFLSALQAYTFKEVVEIRLETKTF